MEFVIVKVTVKSEKGLKVDNEKIGVPRFQTVTRLHLLHTFITYHPPAWPIRSSHAGNHFLPTIHYHSLTHTARSDRRRY